MSELDLGLKVASRRLLWRMGYSTRIDVPLRAFGSSSSPARGPREPIESYTDLDVLGVTLAPGAAVETAIVDCKTGGSSAISRMFWIRGLSEFFSATSAYMVREREISRGARQLATRLLITTLTSEEVTTLETLHPTAVTLTQRPLANLFDMAHVAEVKDRWAAQDKKLKSLLEYREFDYWIYDRHLNLIQMVEHLRAIRHHLDSRNPQHLAILFDCAWLYLLAAVHAIEAIRGVHVSNVARGLKEYVLGGAEQVREKENLASLLGELRREGKLPGTVSIDPLPQYFPTMVDLVTRIMHRNDTTVTSLQYLEYLTSATMVGARTTTADAFGTAHDDIAAKIAENIVAFLVESADLDAQLLTAARGRLFGSTQPPNRSKPEHGGSDAPVKEPRPDASEPPQLDLGMDAPPGS
ncbi:hypothetical protein LZG07_08745 [Microbacterium profundi]|uniref:hypothetical protein n=1 Tax=Microbacterium profundi TaxID=450380 RepID=UPI001F15E18B|nr:hypothetical protein [Microbacterium profundi]MCE7482004.1 hypothetical protein [Microbacterium profundi]